jgi:predicted O-methyltransferase YrrM
LIIKNYFKIDSVLKIYYLKISLILFRLRKPKIIDIERIFDFAIKNFNKPIPFWQIREEIIMLMEILQKHKPKYVLEIGTAGGGSLFMLSQVIEDDAVLISIDLPNGQFGGGYPENRITLYNSFAKTSQKIKLIRQDSHSLESLKSIKMVLKENDLDFLFIDGDHSYEGVKKDFELYAPLVKKNGLIALHDIVQGSPENVGGVPIFWKQLKEKHKHVEIVRDWKQGGYGIGVIYI